MSRIINTKKSKNNRTMIKCNCSICVNRQKQGCRFGWEPINGKCNRFGTNHYNLSKDEKAKARTQTVINQQLIEEEKNKKNEIKNTTIKVLSDALETPLTFDKIKCCTSYKTYGNGKFCIKCNNPEEMIISLKPMYGKAKKYKIIG